jgi:hypothetical protein
VADGTGPASGSDRNAALNALDAALKSGRIIQADHDMRVEQIKSALTASEVQSVVRDLVPQSAAPVTAPVPAVSYGPGWSGASGTAAATDVAGMMKAANVKIPKIAFLLPSIIGVLVIGGFAAGIFAFVSDAVETVGGGSGITDSRTYAPGVEPDEGINVLSAGGYQDLLDAIRVESGSTDSFSAVLYPTYAVVELPVDATSQRSNRFYWNGELESQESFGTSTDQRYDLDEVDPAVLVTLLKKARSRVEAPTSWYAVIGAPTEDGSVLSAYASNAYSETAYILATVDGTITYESSPTPVTPEPPVEVQTP